MIYKERDMERKVGQYTKLTNMELHSYFKYQILLVKDLCAAGVKNNYVSIYSNIHKKELQDQEV